MQYNNGKVTGATKSLDINVVPAWIQGVTGKNVIVTIVDDGYYNLVLLIIIIVIINLILLRLGIDHYHSDLKTNYVSLKIKL